MPVILIVGHPRIIRRCRWWLVVDAYASLAGKGPIRFLGLGLSLAPRRRGGAVGPHP